MPRRDRRGISYPHVLVIDGLLMRMQASSHHYSIGGSTVIRPRSSLLAAIGMIVATLTLIPQPAQAYCASPALEWNSNHLTIRGQSVPAGWTTALRSSASAWSGVSGASWTVSYVPPDFIGPVPSPVVNAYRQASAPPGWGGAPALVDLKYSGGTITGGNVYFNSSFTWNTTGTMNQADKKADVRTIATHEFGHQVYLNHPSSCGAMTTAERAASMNPNWVQKWGTRADDKAGLAVRK